MEKDHLSQLRRKFPDAMQGKTAICLHIPDDYEYMQPELVDELRAALSGHITSPESEPVIRSRHKNTLPPGKAAGCD